MSYESPNYEMLMKKKNFEVRRYLSFQVIQYDNPEDPGANQGFRTLFSYISSENKENRKIPMTKPVLQENKDNQRRMAFVLPRKVDTPPEPLSPHLKITTVPGGIYIVRTYSGSQSREKFDKNKELLSKILETRHYISIGPYMVAFYNPPFTPPFLKKNEVLVKIDPDSFEPVY